MVRWGPLAGWELAGNPSMTKGSEQSHPVSLRDDFTLLPTSYTNIFCSGEESGRMLPTRFPMVLPKELGLWQTLKSSSFKQHCEERDFNQGISTRIGQAAPTNPILDSGRMMIQVIQHWPSQRRFSVGQINAEQQTQKRLETTRSDC